MTKRMTLEEIGPYSPDHDGPYVWMNTRPIKCDVLSVSDDVASITIDAHPDEFVVRLRDVKNAKEVPYLYGNSWRKLIQSEMDDVSESFSDVVKCTLTEEELDADFDAGFGGTKGKPFTLWTHFRVYFPVVYDGAEWVSSVPRTPCDKVTEHVGGG